MANYLIQTLIHQAEKYKNRAFYRFREPGESEWKTSSWQDFHDLVLQSARALLALGCAEMDKAVLCSPNRPELLIAEFACFFNRMGGVPVYASSSLSQFSFIAEDSDATVAFVGSKAEYDMACDYCSTAVHPFDHIILLTDDDSIIRPDDMRTMTWSAFLAHGNDLSLQSAVLERAARGRSSDLASLIYTSGTTGHPKGVVLNHAQFEAQLREHLRRLTDINENELSLCFLPMSHVFEKAWIFFCIVKGLRVAFNYDPREIESVLQEVHPNIMCCVPRFWEKVYSAAMHELDKLSWLQRQMARRALHVGARVNLHYRRIDKKVPGLLMREYKFWDRRFFSKVRKGIGMPEPNIFPTAGAALSPKICDFMRRIGIRVIMGYGMTETTATITCFPKYDFEIGTVGTPLSEIQVKIDNSGEILVKGPTVTPGYYKNDEANAAAFTRDGWLRTGDAGYFNENGALVLSARKKELFKTSNGKYISPGAIESLCAGSRYIDSIAVIGEGRKYVTALVVPNFHAFTTLAEQKGFAAPTLDELCASEKANAFLLNEIHKLQGDVAAYEKVKKITILPEHFSEERGELTNTLKLRRNIIEKNYDKQIQQMYPDESLDKNPF